MCGSISHSCGSGGLPVPPQGPQLQGKPLFADRNSTSTVFSLDPGCCSLCRTTVSPGHGPHSFAGTAALGSPAGARAVPAADFYLPVLCAPSSWFICTCAVPADSLQLPGASHPARPEQPCQECPGLPGTARSLCQPRWRRGHAGRH